MMIVGGKVSSKIEEKSEFTYAEYAISSPVGNTCNWVEILQAQRQKLKSAIKETKVLLRN